MIKFFRKIRYDLMEKSKTGQYFKYAIGEILLVMVGILLALHVSNWNQQRNQLNQEHRILQSLKTDFLESKKRLSETMFMHRHCIRKSSELIKMHEGKIPRPINDSIMNYVNHLKINFIQDFRVHLNKAILLCHPGSSFIIDFTYFRKLFNRLPV
jgi:hypothetical protein